MASAAFLAFLKRTGNLVVASNYAYVYVVRVLVAEDSDTWVLYEGSTLLYVYISDALQLARTTDLRIIVTEEEGIIPK